MRFRVRAVPDKEGIRYMRFGCACGIGYGLAIAVCLALPMKAVADGEDPGKIILGLNEEVMIEELGVALPAKLDTGAQSASLSARQIRTFKRDGQDWVSFDLWVVPEQREKIGLEQDQWRTLELPLSKHVRIKRRAENQIDGAPGYSRRPVVELTLCVRDRARQVDVNLTDRSDFRFPLLVGSEALVSLGALVDPTQSMSGGAPSCSKEETVGLAAEETE